MTVVELVERSRGGVRERTIRLWESDKPPASAKSDTVEGLADALSDKPRGVVCKPEYLAWWQRSDGKIENGGQDDPTLGKEKAPAPPAAKPARAARAKKAPAPPVDDALPRIRPLTERAGIEREIGRHADVVTLDGVEYPLVGCYRLKELETKYGIHQSDRFAVAGMVTDSRPIPARAVRILGAESGRGAAVFKIERAASGKREDGSVDSVPVYPTVFAPKGEHGLALSDCLDQRRAVTAIVRIVIAERNGLTGDERWEGFIFFEAGQPKPKPWALVVEQVFVEPAPPKIATPAKKKAGSRASRIAPGGVEID